MMHVFKEQSLKTLIKYNQGLLIICNENSIQYKNDFITLSTKNLYYKNIKEITLHRSVLQKIFDLGTIDVASHATTPNAGIKLYNLDNYQEVYDFLITKIQTTY